MYTPKKRLFFMFDLTKIPEDKQKHYYSVNGIIYSDYKDLPGSDYYPALPKGKQMAQQPDGCYKIPDFAAQ
jgi:hypothetical protein